MSGTQSVDEGVSALANLVNSYEVQDGESFMASPINFDKFKSVYKTQVDAVRATLEDGDVLKTTLQTLKICQKYSTIIIQDYVNDVIGEIEKAKEAKEQKKIEEKNSKTEDMDIDADIAITTASEAETETEIETETETDKKIGSKDDGMEIDPTAEPINGNENGINKEAGSDEAVTKEKFKAPESLHVSSTESANVRSDPAIQIAFTKKVFTSNTITDSQKLLLNKLSIILDFYMMTTLIKDPEIDSELKAESKPVKKTNPEAHFFDLFSYMSKILDTHSVNHLWVYVESRTNLIKEKGLFSRGSLILFCNNLLKRLVSDDDIFISRIRETLSIILELEEPTGLNKNYETSEKKTEYDIKSRDSLYQDYNYILDLLNNPYKYIKKDKAKELSDISRRMLEMAKYINDSDITYYKKLEIINIHIVPKEKPEHVHERLLLKYSQKEYFPVNATLSGEYFQLKFDDLKFRQVMMIQMFIIAGFYYHLNESNKIELLDLAGCPPGSRFPIEDGPPERLVNIFFKLKKEIPHMYRMIDLRFASVLPSIRDHSEKAWFCWLLNGGKNTFATLLPEEELKTVSALEKESATFKKRYFNKYATPQLTKKISIERSLEKLEKKESFNSERYANRIVQINNELPDTLRKDEIDQLTTERNVLHWKNLKKLRLNNWLKFGNISNAKTDSTELFNSKLVLSPESALKRSLSNEEDSPSKRVKLDTVEGMV